MSVPRLHAPSEHGQILAVPAFDQVGELLARNRRIISENAVSANGKFYAQVRFGARRLIHELATRYHQECGEPCSEAWPALDVPLPDSERNKPWIVAGHQPELFHPGVWFKNFALHHLARAHGGVALNLIIDTDAAKPPVLHVPHGENMRRVPVDRSSSEAPYEACVVEDETLFASVPARVADVTANWPFTPLLDDFWREAVKQAKRTNLLGERFAAARRILERRFGIVPFEVPMSRVCQTKSFIWFVVQMLGEFEKFHAIYNQTVHDYRQAHGIRSRSHPVPDLARDGDWLETPFWALREGQARRAKLFVRIANQRWSLRLGNEEPLLNGVEFPELVSTCAQKLQIRSRALTTTMFARLFLADLFIHGIGGGIYDELTDRIIERFFNVEAPGYMVVSATLLLPLPRYPDAAEQAHRLHRKVRDLMYQPERFVTNAAELVQAKKDWIARDGATHAERVERFQQIRAINAKLQPHVAAEMQQTQTAFEESKRQIAVHAVAARRDYAFCLYPEAMLREFFREPRTK